jgi:hypothetical protein
MFLQKFFRILKENFLSLGWVGLSLCISAVTIVIVIAGAFFRLVFKEVFQVNSAYMGGVSLILSFVTYLSVVGWFAWRYIRRRLQI